MKTLSLLLCGALAIATVNAQCLASQYLANGACVNYDMTSDKASANKGTSIDTGHTAWLLAATALTMLITPAIGLFYAGLFKAEHATNTILLAFVGFAVITIEWILFGYSFAFGPGSKGYGNFKWGLYFHVAADPSGVYAPGIPHILWAVFQNMFATMAPVFLAGAVVGRMKFGVYILFTILWTLVVYNCLAHWIWGNYIDANWNPTQLGWMNIRGTIDYAGGAVIHITAGFAALAVALRLKKRREYDVMPRTWTWPRLPPQPHNLPLVAIGFALMWFGWFGYTGGANGTANGPAAHALINTQVAASTAMLWWLIIEWLVDRRTTLVGACFGAMSGLVAITPAAGYVWPWTSLIFGIVAASVGFFASRLKHIFRYDDPFDVFAIHGICGCAGMFLTGLFATSGVNIGLLVTNPDGEVIDRSGAWYNGTTKVQLGYQMVGIVVASAFSFVCTYIIVFILDKIFGLRVKPEDEDRGLDAKYHGAPAYYFEEPVVATEPVHTAHGHGSNPVVTTEGPLKKDEGRIISS